MSLKPRWPLAAAILIAIVAAMMRIWQARESLWLDELHTAWCAVGGLGEVVQRASSGNQSRLFFWFEWLLVRVLGPSELSLRLPSIIAGSMLPIGVYWLAARGTSGGGGFFGGGRVADCPPATFFW